MVALDKKAEGQNFSTTTYEFRGEGSRLDRQSVIARSHRASRSRTAGRQLKFDWDTTEPTPSNSTNPQSASTSTVTGQSATALTTEEVRPQESPAPTRQPASLKVGKPLPAAASSMRIGEPTKLGLVMMRLLKRYGITDEEIIEALSMPTLS